MDDFKRENIFILPRRNIKKEKQIERENVKEIFFKARPVIMLGTSKLKLS